MARQLIIQLIASVTIVSICMVHLGSAIKRDDYPSSSQNVSPQQPQQQQSSSQGQQSASSIYSSASSPSGVGSSSTPSSSGIVSSSASANHQSSVSSPTQTSSVTFANSNGAPQYQQQQAWRDLNQGSSSSMQNLQPPQSTYQQYGNSPMDQIASASSQSNSYQQAADSVNQALSSSGLLAAQGASYSSSQGQAPQANNQQQQSQQPSGQSSLFYYYYPPGGKEGSSNQGQNNGNNKYSDSYGSSQSYASGPHNFGNENLSSGLSSGTNGANNGMQLDTSASHQDASYAPASNSMADSQSQSQSGPMGSLGPQDYQPQSGQSQSGPQQSSMGQFLGSDSGSSSSLFSSSHPHNGQSTQNQASSFSMPPHSSHQSQQQHSQGQGQGQQAIPNGYPTNNQQSSMNDVSMSSIQNALFSDLTPSFNQMPPASYVPAPSSSQVDAQFSPQGHNPFGHNPFGSNSQMPGGMASSPSNGFASFVNSPPSSASPFLTSANPFGLNGGHHHQGGHHVSSYEPTTSATSTSSYNRRYGLGSFIMPMLALAGLSLLIPTMSNIVPAVGRKKRSVDTGVSDHQASKEMAISEYLDRIERYYSIYKNAIENEDCMNRLICELGDVTRGKSAAFVTVIEKAVPSWMVGKMHVFKEGAMSSEKSKCKKYVCSRLHN